MDPLKTNSFLKGLLIGEEVLGLGFVLFGAGLAGAAWYGYTTIHSLSAEINRLDSELASTTDMFAEANRTLASELNRNIDQVREDIEDKVGDISGTVDTLEKLAKTDPELLAKYSKVFFLSENYAPARLADVPSEYKYSADRPAQVIPEILPDLKRMLDRAKRDKVEIYVQSAYRSFATQAALKDGYTITYGAGTANQFSAEQGYSEHQLGTAVDFITPGLGGRLDGFDRTPAYAWLLKNAYRYGFVISYPQGNSSYIFEPWHWRFVGQDLAGDLHEDGKYFYDLDQRDIDKYLISIFD